MPDWFPPRMLEHIPVLPVHGAVETCTYPYYPPAAALALRRDPCLGHFLARERRDTELGRGGGAISRQPTVGGEDTDLCEIYARAGYRILRVADVQAFHRVHTGRLSPGWIVTKFEGDGRLRVRLARLRGRPSLCRETLPVLGGLPLMAALKMVTPWLNRRHAVVVHAYFAKCLGAWRELLQGRRDVRFPYPPAPPAATDALGDLEKTT